MANAKRFWLKLECQHVLSDPGVVGLTEKETVVYVRSLAYGAQHAVDGLLPRFTLQKLAEVLPGDTRRTSSCLRSLVRKPDLLRIITHESGERPWGVLLPYLTSQSISGSSTTARGGRKTSFEGAQARKLSAQCASKNPSHGPQTRVDEHCNYNSSSEYEEDRIEAIYQEYPRKVGKKRALPAIANAADRVRAGGESDPLSFLLDRTKQFRRLYDWRVKAARTDEAKAEVVRFTPHPTTWFNRDDYQDVEAIPGEKTAAQIEAEERARVEAFRKREEDKRRAKIEQSESLDWARRLRDEEPKRYDELLKRIRTRPGCRDADPCESWFAASMLRNEADRSKKTEIGS